MWNKSKNPGTSNVGNVWVPADARTNAANPKDHFLHLSLPLGDLRERQDKTKSSMEKIQNEGMMYIWNHTL